MLWCYARRGAPALANPDSDTSGRAGVSDSALDACVSRTLTPPLRTSRRISQPPPMAGLVRWQNIQGKGKGPGPDKNLETLGGDSSPGDVYGAKSNPPRV